MSFKMTKSALLAAACLASSALALPWMSEPRSAAPHLKAGASAQGPAPWLNPNPILYSFDQSLDHFDPTNTATFSQRYWLVKDFWAGPKSPVIISWCGEYTCPPIIPNRTFVFELAYELGAMVLIPEMRFYGFSQPFNGSAEPLSTDKLRYLTSQQHIEDVAALANDVQRQINSNYSLPADNKNQFVSVGGSYPGALSAWFRLKHPEIVVGALASSAVVNAFVEMPQFDMQLATDAGSACANALKNATQTIEALLPQVQAQFGPDASALSEDDFLWFIADTMAEAAQYGHRELLCQTVLNGSTPLAGFLSYTNDYSIAVLGNDPSGYNSDLLALTGFSDYSDGRSWTWQVCTRMGWWNVAPQPPAFSIRSQRVNSQYFQSMCAKVFQGLPDGWMPDTNATNAYYGGLNYGGSKVFFSNGVEDPWKWASITPSSALPSLDPSITTVEVDCPQCAHCVDLYTPTSADAPELVAEREQVKAAIKQWLSQE